jgi:hypothetical protein
VRGRFGDLSVNKVSVKMIERARLEPRSINHFNGRKRIPLKRQGKPIARYRNTI